jgi:hypothetical protein
VAEVALGEEDAGESELTEGSASDVVAVSERDNQLRVSPGGGEIAQGLERLAGFGGKRTVVEGADPWRSCVQRLVVECGLGLVKCACTVGTTSKACERSGLHRVQTSSQRRVVWVAVEEGEGSLCAPQCVPGARLLHGQVTEARMDMCSQLDVIAHGRELQSSAEVPLREVVVAGVMGHPTGHLR